MKSYISSVNMGSTKSHDNKIFNRSRVSNGCNIPLSEMKYATKNEYKAFSIWLRVTLFVLNIL